MEQQNGKKFGFSTIGTRTIDYEQFDGSMLMKILKKEPSFAACISCGGCTATCSTNGLTNFNVRRLNLLIRRGETKELLGEIDKCMLCGKCWLVCPRGINTRNVLLIIKKELAGVVDDDDEEEPVTKR